MIRLFSLGLVFTLCALAGSPLVAQSTRKVSGEYRYAVPDHVPMEKARHIAETQAKIEALAAVFGWNIMQADALSVKNTDGDSQVDFRSFSESDVKGEWLSDTREPQFSYSIDAHTGRQVVVCRVEGMAREITGPRTEFTAKLLRKVPDPDFESDRFGDGDTFYLYFTAPADGYLAVYLRDETGTVYCLLPYMRDTDGQVPVTGGREYLFFSIDKAPLAERSVVDEYVMTATHDDECNYLYIIFSPNPFTKTADRHAVEGLPRQLSYADFHRWLSRCRTRDARMAVDTKLVTIEK